MKKIYGLLILSLLLFTIACDIIPEDEPENILVTIYDDTEVILSRQFRTDELITFDITSFTKEGFEPDNLYYDQSFENVFEPTTSSVDLNLYIKWVEVQEIGEVEYEIDGTKLVFNIENNFSNYIYKFDDQSHTLQTSEVDIMDYMDYFLELNTFYLYYGDVEVLNINIQLLSSQNAYQTGFEANEGFTASTSYNNQAPKTQGVEPYQFSIVMGTVSTTSPISGEQSMQLRHYTSTASIYGYFETMFYSSGVREITFLAQSSDHDIEVSIKEEGQTEFINPVKFTLNNTNQTLTYPVNTQNKFIVRFQMVKRNETTATTRLYVDDIVMVGISDEPTYYLVLETTDEPVDDYPETDEANLASLKAQYQSERSSLTVNITQDFDSNTYYSSLMGLTGNQFKSQLQQLLTTTHSYPQNYGKARFILELSDLIVDDQDRGYLLGIYSGHKIVKYWDGGTTWAREHVWPNSRLGVQRVSNNTINQASDAHNLRAINPSINSARSNRYFAEGTSSTYQSVGSDAYYPGDEYKGDVARILFYMLARYSDVLSLVDTDIDSGSTYEPSGAKMGILSTLLLWHSQDPVDDFELNRNDVIYSYQGNRNPFIDNPDYVAMYFGPTTTSFNFYYEFTPVYYYIEKDDKLNQFTA